MRGLYVEGRPTEKHIFSICERNSFGRWHGFPVTICSCNALSEPAVLPAQKGYSNACISQPVCMHGTGRMNIMRKFIAGISREHSLRRWDLGSSLIWVCHVQSCHLWPVIHSVCCFLTSWGHLTDHKHKPHISNICLHLSQLREVKATHTFWIISSDYAETGSDAVKAHSDVLVLTHYFYVL